MAHEDLSQVLTDKFEGASAMEGFFLYRFLARKVSALTIRFVAAF